MVYYDFNQLADRQIDRSRKWDYKLLKEKYPNIHSSIIPMWIADMDFKLAPPIQEEFTKIVENGAFGYTSTQEDFYEAIIGWYSRRHQLNVQRDWIRLCYGTVATIHNIYQAFCQPNEKILIFTPVYDPFRYAAVNNGIQVVYNYLEVRENRYYINFDVLEEQLDIERPKLILMCSPHNPSGRIWSRDELTKVAELCQKYDVLLVVDEVHGEITFENPFHTSLTLEKSYYDNLIVLNSPNKAFNFGGLKTSYAIIPNKRLRDTVNHKLKMNSITSPNTLGAVGLTVAYNHGEKWLKNLSGYINCNYITLQHFISKNLPQWQLMPMESSYLPWINIESTGMTGEEMVQWIANKTGVVLEPGSNYAKGGEQYIRVNLGTSKALLIEALERINQLYKNELNE